MAKHELKPVMLWQGRPCIAVSEKKKRHPKFGWFVLVDVRFLDGLQPATAEVSRGKFDKAKQIRGPQGEVWRRVDGLVREGMDPARARQQAMAELTKGVLSAGHPDVEDPEK